MQDLRGYIQMVWITKPGFRNYDVYEKVRTKF